MLQTVLNLFIWLVIGKVELNLLRLSGVGEAIPSPSPAYAPVGDVLSAAFVK